MLAPKREHMPFDDYLAWEAEQDEKWELVDGRPVLRSERWWRDPVTGMAGASYAHNRIVANLIVALEARLKGGPCHALPSDLKVRSAHGNARYPDVIVECGRPRNGDLVATEPRAVFEVLSPSNRPNQQIKLTADYQSVLSVQHLVFVEQFEVDVAVWNRHDGPWTAERYRSVDDALPLPALGISLPLVEIYDGLDLGPSA